MTPAVAERIGSLNATLAPELREEFAAALRTLQVPNFPGVLMSVSRLVEGHRGLLGRVAEAAGHQLRGFDLEKQIEELRARGVLPGEIASDLHWIRVRANKARHHAEQAELTGHEAETALGFALRVAEWLYCECPHGPRADTIYTTRTPVRAVLAGYAARMLTWPRLQPLERCSLELSGKPRGGERARLAELLEGHRRLVLLGSPGGGKSVFLLKSFRATCGALAAVLAADDPPPQPVVPVYLELAQWARGDSLPGLVLRRLGLPAGGDPVAALADLLGQVDLVLFLDGLNELAEPDRGPCVQQLTDLHRHLFERDRNDCLQVVVTTRPYGFSGQLARRLEDEGYLLADVLPLTADEIGRHFCDQFPGPADEGKRLFAQLGPKIRHLLSNPQHLSYALEWYRDQWGDGGTDAPRQTLRTRGMLLAHCIGKRLAGLADARLAPLADDMLRRLAYRQNSAAVYYSQPTLLQAAEEAVTAGVVDTTARQLVQNVCDAELLLPSVDHAQFRFPHHSHQQYFAARAMRDRWPAEWRTYLDTELWHEPLVIMAGLLDDAEARELLAATRRNDQLHAYVLANIDQPEDERRFQVAAAAGFVRGVRFWAGGLAWVLAGLFLGWFLLVPVVAYLVFVYRPAPGPLALAVNLAALGGTVALPWGLHAGYRRWFARQRDRLRERRLPRLLRVLRYLEAEGALRSVREELAGLRDRLAVLPDDPRMALFNEALGQIDRALDGPSFMTEDEMLGNIADPLVAVRIDAEHLSDHAVEVLMAMAGSEADVPGSGQVLAKLHEVYVKRPEFRADLGKLFARVAAGTVYPRPRRRRAAAICHQLGLAPGGAPAAPEGLFRRLARFLLRLVGLGR